LWGSFHYKRTLSAWRHARTCRMGLCLQVAGSSRDVAPVGGRRPTPPLAAASAAPAPAPPAPDRPRAPPPRRPRPPRARLRGAACQRRRHVPARQRRPRRNANSELLYRATLYMPVLYT